MKDSPKFTNIPGIMRKINTESSTLTFVLSASSISRRQSILLIQTHWLSIIVELQLIDEGLRLSEWTVNICVIYHPSAVNEIFNSSKRLEICSSPRSEFLCRFHIFEALNPPVTFNIRLLKAFMGELNKKNQINSNKSNYFQLD